jgi:hypothetical protein
MTAKQNPQLTWCVVRLGQDMNWWVTEISDPVHWDADGLSIIDPRQMSHIIELSEPLREYGFDMDLLDEAFFTFRIDREVGEGQIRLVRLRDSLLTSEEKLFALPNILNEDKGPYAELIDQLVKARVKLLNDTLDLEQPLTTDEIEELLTERAGLDYSEGRALHVFTELNSILEYVPEGFEDEIDEGKAAKPASAIDDIPDVVEEHLEQDETMKWGDEEEKDEEEDDKEVDEDEDDSDEDEDDDKPKKPSKPMPPAKSSHPGKPASKPSKPSHHSKPAPKKKK